MQVCLISAQGGCQPNVLLCSQLVSYLTENHHRIVTDEREADCVFISTCAFSDFNEYRSIKLIEELHHKLGTGVMIISIGCLNKINRSALEKKFPALHLVENFHELDKWFAVQHPFSDEQNRFFDDEILRNHIRVYGSRLLLSGIFLFSGRCIEHMSRLFHYPHVQRAKITLIIDEIMLRNKVFVEIGTGCVGNCHYCVIKKAKGSPKSRKICDVLHDVRKVSHHLANNAIFLVADDCGGFGIDTGETLFDLITRIFEEFPAAKIDLGYLNPMWLTLYRDRFLEMFAHYRINSVNISMQSGSDDIIRAMNRHYGIDDILSCIQKIRSVSPRTFLFTHFIVGYPGETWAEFVKTMRASRYFDCFLALPFSPRDGTIASTMDNSNHFVVGQLRRVILYSILCLRLSAKLFLPKKLGSKIQTEHSNLS